MAKTRRKYASGGSTKKVTYKPTKLGYKKKEVTKTTGDRKLTRKVKVKGKHIKSKVRKGRTIRKKK
tara:strand:+ start:632 stop:829 length:198 start_codon:yes stop_codon:yes gene_type:complete